MMIERINTRRTSPERTEKSEQIEKNAREYLDLRLRFAEAVSSALGIPLTDALRDYTDLHIRLTGKPRGRDENMDHIWDEFAASIATEQNHTVRLDSIVATSKVSALEDKEAHERPFDPFRYDYDAEHRAVDLHFGTIRPDASDPDVPGVLSGERLPEMRSILAKMFAEIKREHPEAEIVRGGSWLYNREAYRRLYPASYTADPRIRRGNKFTGGGTWGQFRDKTGAVNEATRKEFLENLERLDPDHLEDAFPNKTLMVSGPISDFYKEYGIE